MVLGPHALIAWLVMFSHVSVGIQIQTERKTQNAPKNLVLICSTCSVCKTKMLGTSKAEQ